MKYILTALGLIVFLVMWGLWIKINNIFFQIQALKAERKYLGYFKEYFSLPTSVVFSSEFVNFFPLTFLVKRQVVDKSSVLTRIELLYIDKIKLERVFWFLFLLAIISIPVVELIIKPYLL
jgi:hypothetical protein